VAELAEPPNREATQYVVVVVVGCAVPLCRIEFPLTIRCAHAVIWAYKILFLDVLFPLSVKRVIFVDADQIIRADLKELRDMNLHGAPYGYTPFCDSRKEMDGFRFWKSGYWQRHLNGLPYHISALYVVDLERYAAKCCSHDD